jgi:hypothetical protein
MTGFSGEKQAFNRLQSVIGSHALRFVQQYYAADISAFFLPARHLTTPYFDGYK